MSKALQLPQRVVDPEARIILRQYRAAIIELFARLDSVFGGNVAAGGGLTSGASPDGLLGDIKAVAAANAKGASGRLADAAHEHKGVASLESLVGAVGIANAAGDAHIVSTSGNDVTIAHDWAEAGDILPVGTTASAGNIKEVPCANHIHEGVHKLVNGDTSTENLGDVSLNAGNGIVLTDGLQAIVAAVVESELDLGAIGAATSSVDFGSQLADNVANATASDHAVNLGQLWRLARPWDMLSMSTAASPTISSASTWTNVSLTQAIKWLDVPNTESRVAYARMVGNARVNSPATTGKIGMFDTSNNLICEADVTTAYGPRKGSWTDLSAAAIGIITSGLEVKLRVQVNSAPAVIDILAAGMSIAGADPT